MLRLPACPKVSVVPPALCSHGSPPSHCPLGLLGPTGTSRQDMTSFDMELSSSGISADLSEVPNDEMRVLWGWSRLSWPRTILTLFLSFSEQGRAVVGAAGAKDWAGGFLDLKEDLQDATFVGNEPLTSDMRAGYLGELAVLF